MVASMEHSLIKQRTQRLVDTRLKKLRVGRQAKLIVKKESATGLLSNVWLFEKNHDGANITTVADDDQLGDESEVEKAARKVRKLKSVGECELLAKKKKERIDAVKRKKKALKELA